MINYPDTLPKPSYKGHSNNPSQDYHVTEMDYASKRRAKYYGIFTIPLMFKFTRHELNDFNSWYFGNSPTQLLRGARIFQASWEVLGIFAPFEFAFTKGGQPRVVPLSPDLFEVKCEVELKTDIYEIIVLNSLEGFCPEIIDCQTDLLEWAKTA